MKKRKKGQAAMEFLMTYGWAILVVLVVIGALVYFMGPNIVQSMIPTKCVTGDAGVVCKAARVAVATVDLRYQNNYDEQVIIDSVAISRDGASACTTQTGDTTIAAGASANLAQVIGCSLTLGQKVKLEVTTTLYKASETSAFTHPVKGEVVATVQ